MLINCNNNANYENSNLFINLTNPSIKINNLNSMIANENFNNNKNNSLSLKYDLNKEAYAITHTTNNKNLLESQYDLKTFQSLNKNINSND